MLTHLSESLLSLVFPVACETCQAPLPPLPALGVCERCRSEIKLLKAPHCVTCGRTVRNGSLRCGLCADEHFHYDRAFACTIYQGKVKELLHAYKFGRRKYLKNYFVSLMIQFFRAHLKESSFDAVAAVPLSAHTKNLRGFNQSELMASQIAGVLGLKDASGKLERKKSSSPQSLLTKPDRKINVQGRFVVKEPSAFKGKRLLLVDDVLTTGQTASECARTLKNAGCAGVTVLACARGA